MQAHKQMANALRSIHTRRDVMRVAAIVVLVLALGVSACNQASPPSTTTQKQTDQTTANQAAGGAGAPAPGAATAAPAGSGPAAAAPAAPAFDEVTLPTGTELSLALDTPVSSETSKVQDQVRAHLSKTVVVDGVTALPVGSTVDGMVTAAERSGKVKGRAHVAFRFDRLTRAEDPEHYRIDTAAVSRTAAATNGKDALKVGGGGLGGAIVGGIIGGKKGAAIGTAVGAGAGGAVVMSTRGDEVRLAKGSALTVRLTEPLVVRVPHR